MAKRGDAAKQVVVAAIQEAFGENFIGYLDKKAYVNVRDGANGEVVQLAISITMPKTPIDAPTKTSFEVDSSDLPPWETKPATPTELSPDDKEKVAMLLEKLGL